MKAIKTLPPNYEQRSTLDFAENKVALVVVNVVGLVFMGLFIWLSLWFLGQVFPGVDVIPALWSVAGGATGIVGRVIVIVVALAVALGVGRAASGLGPVLRLLVPPVAREARARDRAEQIFARQSEPDAAVLIFVINRAYFGWTIQPYWPWGAMLQQAGTILTAAVAASIYPAVRASRTPAAELSRENV